MHVNSAKGEAGDPLGLDRGHAIRQPGKKSSPKKNFLPNGSDHQSIGEKGEERLGIAGLEEADHRGLGFEGKTEKKKEARAEEEQKQDRQKKDQQGVKGETCVGNRVKTKYSPLLGGFFPIQDREEESDGDGEPRKERGKEPGGEAQSGGGKQEGCQRQVQGGSGGGWGWKKKNSKTRNPPETEGGHREGEQESRIDQGGKWGGPRGHPWSVRETGTGKEEAKGVDCRIEGSREMGHCGRG